MKNKLKLGIVIPVYNEQEYITACLESIARQTVMPDEVIIVDNNSRDSTVELVRRYQFVKVISEPKQGIVHARNAGFDTVKSDIIGRIDADSILAPDWVSNVKSYFAANPDAGAVTGHCYFYDFPARDTTQFIHHLTYYSAQKLLAGTEVLWGSNMAIRRRSWRQVRRRCNKDNDVHEDIDLSLRLKHIGHFIGRSETLSAGVSMRRGNLSPESVVRYLSPWPKTYWASRNYGAALGISILYIGLLAWVIPILYAKVQLRRLLEAYDY